MVSSSRASRQIKNRNLDSKNLHNIEHKNNLNSSENEINNQCIQGRKLRKFPHEIFTVLNHDVKIEKVKTPLNLQWNNSKLIAAKSLKDMKTYKPRPISNFNYKIKQKYSNKLMNLNDLSLPSVINTNSIMEYGGLSIKTGITKNKAFDFGFCNSTTNKSMIDMHDRHNSNQILNLALASQCLSHPKSANLGKRVMKIENGISLREIRFKPNNFFDIKPKPKTRPSSKEDLINPRIIMSQAINRIRSSSKIKKRILKVPIKFMKSKNQDITFTPVNAEFEGLCNVTFGVNKWKKVNIHKNNINNNL